jgi:hypothetical protein
MPEQRRINIDNEKYTVVVSETGVLKVLRYGEEWRDCTGDKFILSMTLELEALRKEIERLKPAKKETIRSKRNHWDVDEWVPIPYNPGDPQPRITDGVYRGIRTDGRGGFEGIPFKKV